MFERDLRHQDPFRFWAIKPDGERALNAYEHIRNYYWGGVIQHNRIYDTWRESSALKGGGDDELEVKKLLMKQVIRDIHFLLVCKQIIWKSLQQMSSPSLFPSFTPAIDPLRQKWGPFFESFKPARNTFEHFEDQIFGPDTRRNSPGYGVTLKADGSFALGTHTPVTIGPQSKAKLAEFLAEFDQAIDSVAGPVGK